MWKRFNKQIGTAGMVMFMGAALMLCGLLADWAAAAFVRTVGVLAVVIAGVALCSMWSSSRRVARITKDAYAEWTAEDGARVALYKRAVLANGVLHDFSTPGVRIISRAFEHGVLTVEYSYRRRGGVEIERIVLTVPDETYEAVQRYIDDDI